VLAPTILTRVEISVLWERAHIGGEGWVVTTAASRYANRDTRSVAVPVTVVLVDTACRGHGGQAGSRLRVRRHHVTGSAHGRSAFTTGTAGQGLAAGDTIRNDATPQAEVNDTDGSCRRMDSNRIFTLQCLSEQRDVRQVQRHVSVGPTRNRSRVTVGELAT
jgi:hypothetical protein